MRKLQKIFKAVGDNNRLRILKMLEVRPLCNCEVQEILGLAASTVSKHLGLLRDAGLVEDQRKGKWVIYRLVDADIGLYGEPILGLIHQWLSDDTQVLQDLKRVNAMQGKFACDPGE